MDLLPRKHDRMVHASRKGLERTHSTYIRSIHQTRKIATMAPAMWMIQSAAVLGLPKLNMRPW